MHGYVGVKARSLIAALAGVVVVIAGCSTRTEGDDEVADDSAAISETTSTDGVVYFHGMSRLGFSRDELRTEIGGSRDLQAPSLTDAQLQSAPAQSVLTFLDNHPTSGVVSGYSLGRVLVFCLMKLAPPNMTRVVMIDPTYDSASGMGSGIGGGITRNWLDGSPERSFLLVYGDVTKDLGGERSYVAELANHPRAELCYVPGDHARFRNDDMARALVAESCSDLKARLDP
jgi:hypothetical protein